MATLAELNSPVEETRVKALIRLRWVRSDLQFFSGRILALTQAKTPKEREHAVALLGELAVPEEWLFDVCEEALRDSNSGVRNGALTALISHHQKRNAQHDEKSAINLPSRIEDRIVLLLEDADAEVVYSAINLLDRHPQLRTRAIPKLVKLSLDARNRILPISDHFQTESPLCQDAVSSLKRAYHETLSEAAKNALKEVLSEQAAPGVRTIARTAMFQQEELVADITDALSRGADEDLQEIFHACQLHKNDPPNFFLPVYREISKTEGSVGFEAGVKLLALNDFWESNWVKESIDDKKLPAWLRGAMETWIKNRDLKN